MAYGRKYPSRKPYRRPRTVRRRVAGKPSSSKNRGGLLALSRKVNKIQRTVSARTQHLTFVQTQNFDVSADYTVKSMTPLSSWVQIFGNNINADESNKLICKSAVCKYQIYKSSEAQICNSTVVVLTPKSLKVYNETSGMNTLVDGTDYTSPDGSLVLINLKRFKVHYMKRHLTQGRGGGEHDLTSLRDQGTIRLKNLNWPIKNTISKWDDTSITQLPYYMHVKLFVFTNNSAGDFQYPSLQFNNIWQTCAQ